MQLFSCFFCSAKPTRGKAQPTGKKSVAVTESAKFKSAQIVASDEDASSSESDTSEENESKGLCSINIMRYIPYLLNKNSYP